ncbi:serine hydrolase domain-containing protein [Nitrospirillum sp. BR 11828]|uniref:serine hydrolase domain-containing protein n=1 Tax=Nitrospirillum sp. BR 11828 TaxID=3104325 RepID=UPI002ACA2B31|nr:serine hydrolase domain-containing protein [Nitrospirillum sp. BR 11828]MDZ5645975.1 serine hydrolase domain-containing protein [Nitrospirillum sp. BR 11828]
MRRRELLAMGMAATVMAQTRGSRASSAVPQMPLPMPTPFPPETTGRFEGLVRELNSPGAILTVTDHGHTAFQSWGRASLSFAVPVTVDTLFDLGPAGRHMTAACVLQLADDNRIDIQQPVGLYVPQVPTEWAGRSIQSLLTHTSGLPDYLDALPDLSRAPGPETVRQVAGGLPPRFDAGTAWAPSNTDDLLLGWLVEAVTKLRFGDFLSARIFGPANVRSGLADDGELIIWNKAEPYEPSTRSPGNYGKFIHAPLIHGGAPYTGGGGILFSVNDIASWDRAWDRGQRESPTLSARAVTPTLLATGRTIPYGYGWHLGQTRGMPYHLRAGSLPGYSAVILRLPAAGLSVTACANVSGVGDALRHMAWVAAEIHTAGCTPLTLAPIAADSVDKRLASILECGVAGQPDTRSIAPEIQAVLTLPSARREVLPALKPPISLTPIEEYAVPQGRMRRYRVVSPTGMDSLLAGFDGDDRLYWLQAH